MKIISTQGGLGVGNKSFKVAFISDIWPEIHIDFYINPKLEGDKLIKAMTDFINNELVLKPADILVFAGDNSHYPKQNKLMLEMIAAKKMYKKIFVTFGNHDLYLISNQQRSKYNTSWDKVLELKSICEAIDTVEFLDGNIVEVDGIKIGGAGLFYDMSYGKNNFGLNHFAMMHLWIDSMNDANLIKGKDYPPEINDSRSKMYGYSNIYKEYTFDPIKFFNLEKEKMIKIIDKCDIFVSHIGPIIPPNLDAEYQNAMTGFYYFDGAEYLSNEKAPKLYIFGHTHKRYDFKFNNTWMMCNPLGYKSEKTNNEIVVVDLFDLDFV